MVTVALRRVDPQARLAILLMIQLVPNATDPLLASAQEAERRRIAFTRATSSRGAMKALLYSSASSA